MTRDAVNRLVLSREREAGHRVTESSIRSHFPRLSCMTQLTVELDGTVWRDLCSRRRDHTDDSYQQKTGSSHDAFLMLR
jgi:hypothetical protein